MTEEKEKIYSIPLRSFGPKTKRTSKTVKILREYVIRHMKSDNVWMDPKLNDFLWDRGIKNPPAKIRVKAVKFEDGLVEVSLPELEEKEKGEKETAESEKDKEKKKVGKRKKGEKIREKVKEKAEKQKKTKDEKE